MSPEQQAEDGHPKMLLEGKYRIKRPICRGGMGEVYEAEHVGIGRRVAIKVLLDTGGSATEAIERFEQEARIVSQIRSDHVVDVLDFGSTPPGERFIVLEYLEGQTLSKRMRAGQLDPLEIRRIALELLDGLAAAHDAGVIHRDLKPSNVFLVSQKLGRRDFVKILDFGVSKLVQSLDGPKTRSGAIVGTPLYMSPEQARGKGAVDARSDLYSVGVILFEALTGTLPFDTDTLARFVYEVLYAPIPHPKKVAPHLDDGLAAIVHKAMARDPDRRYQSARELARALADWEPGKVCDLALANTTVVEGRSRLAPMERRQRVPHRAAPPTPAAILVDPPSTQPTWGASTTVRPPKPEKGWLDRLIAIVLGVASLAMLSTIMIAIAGGKERRTPTAELARHGALAGSSGSVSNVAPEETTTTEEAPAVDVAMLTTVPLPVAPRRSNVPKAHGRSLPASAAPSPGREQPLPVGDFGY